MKTSRVAAAVSAMAFVLACGADGGGAGSEGPDVGGRSDGGSEEACADDRSAPKVTSSLADITFAGGQGTATRTIVFDEAVTIAVDGIVIAPGATIAVTPALPATATSFTVVATGLADGNDYTLTALAAKTRDACGNALSADVTSSFTSECTADTTAPHVTSSSAPYRFAGTSFTHTLTFDEPVSIAAGGITASNGATVATTPALPATASSFVVEVGALAPGTTYTLTASAASIADVCGHPLASNHTLTLTGCGGDASPPVRVSPAFTGSCARPLQTYALVFDEPVTLAANALSIDKGATIASVAPPLPGRATSFEVALANLTGAHTLSVATAKATDDCGNATAAPITVENGSMTAFEYTGGIVTFTVPDCPGTTIEAWGAQGGRHANSAATSGLGARMKGDFDTLTPRAIKVLVGEMPSDGEGNGGGGGTFVVKADDAPLLVAGGGGGSGDLDAAYKHGSAQTSGQTCTHGGGAGGVDGQGGGAAPTGIQSGAGGGLLTSGANGWTSNTGGRSFLLGGAGGTENAPASGGFGGGGSGTSIVVGGGGGGYSGGSTCSNPGGGRTGAGGGSFNAGTNQSNASGANAGHGRVVIKVH